MLDTHIAFWAALKPAALHDAERVVMEEAATQLVLSAVSIWDLRLKWHSDRASGARKGSVGPEVILAFAAAVDWTILSLNARHAAAGLAVALAHKDAFDELFLVQAQEEGLHLLTRDANLIHRPLSHAR